MSWCANYKLNKQFMAQISEESTQTKCENKLLSAFGDELKFNSMARYF